MLVTLDCARNLAEVERIRRNRVHPLLSILNEANCAFLRQVLIKNYSNGHWWHWGLDIGDWKLETETLVFFMNPQNLTLKVKTSNVYQSNMKSWFGFEWWILCESKRPGWAILVKRQNIAFSCLQLAANATTGIKISSECQITISLSGVHDLGATAPLSLVKKDPHTNALNELCFAFTPPTVAPFLHFSLDIQLF